jgi:hypothetical protein
MCVRVRSIDLKAAGLGMYLVVHYDISWPLEQIIELLCSLQNNQPGFLKIWR